MASCRAQMEEEERYLRTANMNKLRQRRKRARDKQSDDRRQRLHERSVLGMACVPVSDNDDELLAHDSDNNDEWRGDGNNDGGEEANCQMSGDEQGEQDAGIGEELELINDSVEEPEEQIGLVDEAADDGEQLELGIGIHEDENSDSDDEAGDDGNPASQEEQSASDSEAEFLERFRDWYANDKKHFTERPMNRLLKVLRTRLPMLPKCCRTLRPKIKDVDVKVLDEEKKCFYVHLGLKTGLQFGLRGLCKNDIAGGNVKVWLYIDGVAMYDSSEMPCDMWPLVLRIANVPGLEMEPIVVGIYMGSHKPTSQELLNHFCEELEELSNNGFFINEDDEGDEEGGVQPEVGTEKVFLTLDLVIADAPARAMLKIILGHGGFFGCERCEQKGMKVAGTTVWALRKPRDKAEARTDASFRTRRQPEHHHKGNCPFETLDLLEPLDMIRLFPLDPMHLVWLGVCKRVIEFIFKVQGLQGEYSLSRKVLTALREAYKTLKPNTPVEFARPPRAMKEYNFKAVELRLLFLYTVIAFFMGRVKTDIWKAVCQLHCALRILVDPARVAVESELKQAEGFIYGFVLSTGALFGPVFISYNTHSLLHLVDDVRKYGLPLDKFSAFFSENFFRELQQRLHGPTNPIKELAGDILRDMEHQRKRFPRGVRQKRNAGRVQYPIFSLKAGNDPDMFKNCRISDSCYIRSEKEGDRYVEVGGEDGYKSYIIVDSIFRGANDNEHRVIGRELHLFQEEFFVYPIPSSSFGMKMSNDVTGEQQMWPLSSISAKLFRIPLHPNAKPHIPSPVCVLIPIIHTDV
jgi:hypothetical protein